MCIGQVVVVVVDPAVITMTMTPIILVATTLEEVPGPALQSEGVLARPVVNAVGYVDGSC